MKATIVGILAAVAVAPGAPPAGVIVLRRCAIEPARATRLGAPLSGVIQDCLVRLGDDVKAGQVLGRLQDRELRAELLLREAEARTDVSIRAAQTRHELALMQFRVGDRLAPRRAISQEEHEKLSSEVKVAALAVEEARHRRSVAELQSRRAEAAIRERELVSPHDGVVVAVYRSSGESVNTGDAVFRVVTTDRLQVIGYLDVADAWRVRPGHMVRVVPETDSPDLEVSHAEFSGKIVFVDREIDRRTQTCKIVAEVDSRGGLLRAGLDARMEIAAGAAPVKASPAH